MAGLSSTRVMTVAALVTFAAAPQPLTMDTQDSKRVAARLAELWVEPRDIAARDLFHGPGGPHGVPSKGDEFTVIGRDTTGYSSGYDARDQSGREWDIKVGNEAQPEVVANRVLWAIGYHQPVVHFVQEWKKKGGDAAPPSSARFRLQSDHETAGEWSWQDNPFTGTRELKGLIVANLVLNNWDLKASNNRVYTAPASSPGPGRWFVVQDIGASLGRTGWPIGNRNDIDGFESQDLVASFEGGVIKFDYHARHRELLENIAPADVAWVCGLLSGITDRQWADAFRAATYSPELAARYIAKLQSKIAQGVALGARRETRP